MCRRLLRTPLFTAVTILTLGVGIGATAAIFSVVYGVLLKPLPFAEPDRLVGVWHNAPGMKLDLLNQSPSTYFTIGTRAGPSRTPACGPSGRCRDRPRRAERIRALMVTDGLLPLLGVQPHLGRLITKADDSPGAPAARAASAYGYWQRRFGGSPNVIGMQLTVEGRPCRGDRRPAAVVLVPDHRAGDGHPAVAQSRRHVHRQLQLSGHRAAQAGRDDRRREPRRRADAAADARTLPAAARLHARDVRRASASAPTSARSMVDAVGDIGSVLWVLLGTVGIVLLIACANVANLFWCDRKRASRNSRCGRRSAPAAAAWRASCSRRASRSGWSPAPFGLVLAALSLVLLRKSRRPDCRGSMKSASTRSSSSSRSASRFSSGLLFGIIPVLRFGTPKIAALKEGGRSSSDGPSRHRTRNVLVVAEIALALVLLIVSGLMIRTFVALNAVDPGFRNAEDVQTFRIFVPDALIKEDRARPAVGASDCRSLARVPGVSSVGITSAVTMDGNNSNDPIFIEEFPMPAGRMPPLRRYKWVGPGYVETMGNHMVAGRALTWEDSAEMRHVVMISERLAREYLEGSAAGDRQAHPAVREEPVEGNRRRGRRRARRRRAPAGDDDGLLAAPGEELLDVERRIERGVAYVVRRRARIRRR